MIKAKFQQRQDGTLYKKGDIMEGLPEERQAKLVANGHAEWSPDVPDELPDEGWTVPEIKEFMDENKILYTSDMLKDDLLDKVPAAASHLLMPEVNTLHYLRAIRFRRTDVRGPLVRRVYNETSSQAVRRACIDCWRQWRDRASFISLRNDWQNLGPDEQRMVWLAAGSFGDDGTHARNQLRRSLNQVWRLGFEPDSGITFASCYEDWADNGG